MKTLTFAKRCAKEILRDPINIGFGLGFPLVLLWLLSMLQANIPVSLFEIDALAPGITVFGLSFLTLECRRSNAVAQSLYHKLGFKDVGFRKRYYENSEDALIMYLQPLPEGHPENDPFLKNE